MNIITSNTPIPHIFRLLAQAGCPDISEQLDLPRCSEWRLPEGGRSDVYKGALVDGRQVAIKTARGDSSIDLSEGDLMFKRTARELHTWSILSHPNIAQFLGMTRFRGRVAMVSAWVYPGNFYEFIGKFPETNRMDLCKRIANGLEYLHEKKLVHGGLRAKEVLIGVDGIPKITDFGLSILKNSGMLFSSTTNVGGGNTRWMAPELIENLTGRTVEADLYALGMTFIEVFTGQIPFPNITTEVQVIYRVIFNNQTPDQPQTLNVRSLRHERWWATLKLCWDRDPSLRTKASAWGELDDEIIKHRSKQLADELIPALNHGRTKEGPLQDLDTKKTLSLSYDKIIIFAHCDDQDPGAIPVLSMISLMQQLTPSVEKEQHISGIECTQALQDRIYECLDERVAHVRHWIDVNVAGFSPMPQMIHDLYDILDYMVSTLRNKTEFCSSQCSTCNLHCLLASQPSHTQHHCGTNHNCISDCAFREEHQKPEPCGIEAGHRGIHACKQESHLHQASTSGQGLTLEITSRTTLKEVVSSLAMRGCSNLTDQLDLSACSEYPIFKGGLGDIYRGKLRTGMDVAIKQMRIYGELENQSQKQLKRAAHELYTWSKCKHPNIQQLHGLVHFRGQIGMISEWEMHGNLSRYLEGHPNADRCDISVKISDGLSYLHRTRIVHGDLKGANILIAANGTPRLVDFGSAILQEYTLEFSNSTTRPGITVRWAAPEVLTGETMVSFEADVYALGMTILEIITGKVPFFNKAETAVIFTVMFGERYPARPETIIPEGSEQGDKLWHLLKQCWNFEPKTRPSAEDVKLTMEGITQDSLQIQ